MNYSDQTGIDQTLYVTLPILDRSINTETTGEYTLSDDQVEIRRVLAVLPKVLAPAKYVGGGGVELSGTVDYSVLYVGSDGELYSLPLSSEYHLTLPLEADHEMDPGAGVTVFADVISENVSFRVSTPKKLSVRCRLLAQVSAFGKLLLEERRMGDAHAASLFRRTEQGRSILVGSGSSDVISLSCEIAASEDTRVISADATVTVSDVRMMGETASVVGEVLLKLLLMKENGTPTVTLQKLPLSGEVELEGVRDADECLATGRVSELSIEMGEDGRILCRTAVLLSVKGTKNSEITYTADLFSGERSCECEYGSYRLPVAIRCEHRNFSQSERIPCAELSMPEECTVCDVWGSVIFRGCENSGGKYLLTGESRYQLLCEKEGEYSVTELTLPIRYETEGTERDAERFFAEGSMLSCRARREGETLCLDAEIAVAASFLGFEEISAVREARFGEAYATKGSRMTVYYPAEGEGAWQVAKKYHISPDRITKAKAYYYF